MSLETATLFFDSETFPIKPNLFLLLQSDSSPPSITITSVTNRDSVLQFIAACHHQSPLLTRNNVNDSFLLAVEWDVPSFTSDIASFISSQENLHTSFIPLLSHATAHGCDITALASIAASHFVELREELLELSLPLLASITPAFTASVPTQVLFPFLLDCLTRFEAPGSLLFSTFDFRKINADQLRALLGAPQFLWNCVNRSLGQSGRTSMMGINS
jgi:hypothetical protein